MTKVTVIIPNYNHSKYLEQRIESVINQTFRNFEILILDDCSTDNSKEIIEKYRQNAQVNKIVYNEINSGSTFSQWQKGISLCNSEYIWIAESDDFAHKEFLKTTIDILDVDNSIGLAYCDAETVDENGISKNLKRSDARNQIKLKWTTSYIIDGLKEIHENLGCWCSINNASAVLFRRSAIINYINLNKFRFAGDWFIYVGIALQYKIAYIHQPLSFYREHTVNASKNAFIKNALFVEHFKIHSFIYNRLTSVARAKYASQIISNIYEGNASILLKIDKIKLYFNYLFENPKLFIVTYYQFIAKLFF